MNECTTAYRGYRVHLLDALLQKKITSEGYSFFVESLFHVVTLTPKIEEFPIFFEDRTAGVSKINKIEIIKSIFMLLKLCRQRVARVQTEYVAVKAH